MKNIKKFDIVLADLNPRKGHVQSGVRQAVVVQSNLFNRCSPHVIVVPLTTHQKKS
jgi:mRNA interferase MazF